MKRHFFSGDLPDSLLCCAARTDTTRTLFFHLSRTKPPCCPMQAAPCRLLFSDASGGGAIERGEFCSRSTKRAVSFFFLFPILRSSKPFQLHSILVAPIGARSVRSYCGIRVHTRTYKCSVMDHQARNVSLMQIVIQCRLGLSHITSTQDLNKIGSMEV